MSEEAPVRRSLSADAMQLLRRMAIDSQLAPDARVPTAMDARPEARQESSPEPAAEPLLPPEPNDNGDTFHPSALDRWAEVRAQMHADASVAEELAPADPVAAEPSIAPAAPETPVENAAGLFTGSAVAEPEVTSEPVIDQPHDDPEHSTQNPAPAVEPEPVVASFEPEIAPEPQPEPDVTSVPEPEFVTPPEVQPEPEPEPEPEPGPAQPVTADKGADVFITTDEATPAPPGQEAVTEPITSDALEVAAEIESAPAAVDQPVEYPEPGTQHPEPVVEPGEPALKASGNVKIEAVEGPRKGAKFLGKGIVVGATGAHCAMDRFDLPVGTRVKLSLIAPRFVDQIEIPDGIVLGADAAQGKLEVQLAFVARHNELETFALRHFGEKQSGGFFSRFRR